MFRFGRFELDPLERRLAQGDSAVTLTPKVFDTLVLLVERAGHVVGKDELMTALWPRGFVDESNLTKHIWLIRKALDDGSDDSCIETVPKHGYRFTASVECIARSTIEAATAQTLNAGPAAHALDSHLADSVRDIAIDPASPRPRRARIAWAASIALALFAAAIALWWRHAPAPARATPQSGSIAIIDFGNLSQNARDAWLAPALTQMLATELAAGGTVHALPDELVRPAHADLPVPAAGGYAPRSLDTLRARVGAEYVLSGSYLVSGDATQPNVRVDVTLQDARDGRLLATLARSAPVAQLPTLVAQAGIDLRDTLGATGASREQLEQIAAAQPPSTDVARRIGLALDAMRRNDPARARDELLDAISQAPDYAPSYSHLAQAWSALGYQAKALAAAQQAAAHAQGLPDEQRIQIDAQIALTTHDWDKAIAALRALVTLRPGNAEYRYQLVATLINAGKADLAQSELAPLLASGAAKPDARLELAQSEVAAAREDDKQAAAHAERALDLARALHMPGLAAAAGTRLGIARTHTGDLAGAEQALKQARTDYAAVGNSHGEAWVDQSLGNAWMSSDPSRARESYQRALAGYQAIGDHGGEAKVESDLGIMLWTGGDRDGAEAAVRKVLALRRETADLAGQAWALTALATILADESATDEVEQAYRDAITLDERSGARAHRAFTLASYADQRRMRGDLTDAAQLCQQAIDGFREVDDGNGAASAQFECALIALDRGDLAAAHAALDAVAAAALKYKDAMLGFNVDLMRAQIAFGNGDTQAAVASVQRAIATAASAQLVSGEAVAQGLYALCAQRLGDTAARDRAKARASELRSRANQKQEVFFVDIALAQLDALETAPEQGIDKLRALAADANQRNWLALSFEARLAEVQALDASADTRRASTLRASLLADAKAHGFLWIVMRLGHMRTAAARKTSA